MIQQNMGMAAIQCTGAGVDLDEEKGRFLLWATEGGREDE